MYYFNGFDTNSFIWGIYSFIIFALLFVVYYFFMFRKEKASPKTVVSDNIADILISKPDDIKDNESICVALTGGWGGGKTYRWENSIKPNLGQRKAIYISCFGKTELKDIKLELLDKLIKKAHPITKFFFGLVLVILTTVVIAGIIFNMNELNVSINWILAIFVISIIFVIFTYIPLLKYFSNKILGVDHNNIDFSGFYKNVAKPILCFDDIERIKSTNVGENILGFINELKNYGYPILLILNTEADNKHKNVWDTFKEKVVDLTFYQSNYEEVLNSILKRYILDEIDKKYILEVFNNMLLFKKNEASYEEEAIKYIKNYLSINFRIIKSIIKNILFVKENTTNYANLDNNMKMAILSYVGLYTVNEAIELPNITNKEKNWNFKELIYKDSTTVDQIIINGIESLYKNYTSKTEPISSNTLKKVGDIVVVEIPVYFYQLLNVKKLLGTRDTENKVIVPVHMTNVEIEATFTPLKMRTKDIKNKVSKLEKLMNEEGEHFTSVNSMGNVLNKYCYSKSLLNKVFEKNDFKTAKNAIENFIRDNKLDIGYFLNQNNELIQVYSKQDYNEYYNDAIEYLNTIFKSFGLDYSASKINQNNFFENYKKVYNDIAGIFYLYILSKDKSRQKQLSDMKLNNYEDFIDIIKYLIYGINLSYKLSIKDILSENNNFIENLKSFIFKEINSLNTLKDSGKSEEIARQALLNDFNTIPDHNLYPD